MRVEQLRNRRRDEAKIAHALHMASIETDTRRRKHWLFVVKWTRKKLERQKEEKKEFDKRRFKNLRNTIHDFKGPPTSNFNEETINDQQYMRRLEAAERRRATRVKRRKKSKSVQRERDSNGRFVKSLPR